MAAEPLILFVPGLRPKPEPVVHRHELFRCLLEGIRRIDPEVATALETNQPSFEIASWTYDFYGEHRDIGLDQADIETLLEKQHASAADRALASSWQRKLVRWLFRAADHLPVMMPHFATEELQLHLHDLNRYNHNKNDIADVARQTLKDPLQRAADAGRPVLLLAHSMGSVIAYDALWQMSQESDRDVSVHLLVTMGSPLGQNVIQRNLLGYSASGLARYPANILDWINLAAIGELTAIDMTLNNDFGEMIDLGLVAGIDDRTMYNYYHMDGELSVHAEYGYLVSEVTAKIVRDWWCQQMVETKPDRDSA
jgi:hypothetical protein